MDFCAHHFFTAPLLLWNSFAHHFKRGVGRGGTNQNRVFESLRLPIGPKNDVHQNSKATPDFFIGVSLLPVIDGDFALEF